MAQDRRLRSAADFSWWTSVSYFWCNSRTTARPRPIRFLQSSCFRILGFGFVGNCIWYSSFRVSSTARCTGLCMVVKISSCIICFMNVPRPNEFEVFSQRTTREGSAWHCLTWPCPRYLLLIWETLPLGQYEPVRSHSRLVDLVLIRKSR